MFTIKTEVKNAERHATVDLKADFADPVTKGRKKISRKKKNILYYYPFVFSN